MCFIKQGVFAPCFFTVMGIHHQVRRTAVMQLFIPPNPFFLKEFNLKIYLMKNRNLMKIEDIHLLKKAG